jgi:serine/threonine protein kinase
MTPEQWTLAERLYHEAAEIAIADRRSWLARACGDEVVRQEVESLLAQNVSETCVLDGHALDQLTHENPGEILVGRQLGGYQFLSLIDEGGMGQVYRARDLTLPRDVAVKVVTPQFTHDRVRRARFRQEAEILATFAHPHIAHIYSFVETEGRFLLAMELVPGETLAARIARGPLPVSEALEIAGQVADALDAAHGQGVIHRDLKPTNIRITPDGVAKVLDFGLATSVRRVPAAPGTTITATAPGTLLGTVAYMSPEQARGESVDKRADIWAFGCVLFEMLTGRRLFDSASTAETLGLVMAHGIDWSLLPTQVPMAVRALLRRCLERDPRKRLGDVAAIRFGLEDIAGAGDPPAATARSPRALSRAWVWSGAVLLCAAVAGMFSFRSVPNVQPEMRLQILADGLIPSMFAISPDGRSLVYQANVDGQDRLWLRSLESEKTKPLQGTERGSRGRLFWSPDGESIGFFADRQLKRIDVASGIVQQLAPSQNANGDWGDGTIVFNRCGSCPLDRVRASGGEVTQVTSLQPGQITHRFPSFLTDRRHFVFLMLDESKHGIYLGSLDSANTRFLFEAESAPVFAPPDYVLFARRGGLWAQRLDLSDFKSIGDPIPVAERVALDGVGFFSIAVSASAAGSIAYQTRNTARQLIWMDRTGRQIATVGRPDDAQPSAGFEETRLLPDGRGALIGRIVDGNLNAWLVDSESGASRRITSESSREGGWVPSSDGTRIVFSSMVNGVTQLFEKSLAGGSAELLLESSELKVPQDWSADGRNILFTAQSAQTHSFDLWALPLDGKKSPIPIAQTAFYELSGRFSPNGRWISYVSEESGRADVYVQAFPVPGKRAVISVDGGTRPEWRVDGRELFYISQDNRLMAVPITINGSRLEPGKPVALFPVRPGSTYAPARDGHRFLVNSVVEGSSPITIVLNWKPTQK